MIKLLCLEDHQLFIDGLILLLEKKFPIKLIRSFNNMNDFLQYTDSDLSEVADILILDLNLYGNNVLDLIPSIKKKSPDLKIIVITMYQSIEMVRKAIDYGALAFITKTSDEKEFFIAFENVLNNNIYISLDINYDENRSIAQIYLSKRENEILVLLKKGFSTKQIADELFISKHTVESHRKNLLRKTSTKNTVEMINFLNRKLSL